MDMNRRKFLKVSSVAAVALAGADALASSGGPDIAHAKGVLVDTAVCIGCRKCEWACNREHKLTDAPLSTYDDKSVFAVNRRPDANAFTVVNQYDPAPGSDKPIYLKAQCLHCQHPACVSACIVGALEKTPEGPVVYDAWECIGCRYCMIACPFQIPAYEYDNALDPRVRKCSMCATERLARGEVPACVDICPNEALTFGDRNELIALAKSKIHAYPERYIDHVYGEHEVGGTSWMYLAPTGFDKVGLPTLDEKPFPEYTEPIQHGVFKWFVPPVALYGLLGLIVHSFKEDKSSEETPHE